jgi:hypothetical protein
MLFRGFGGEAEFLSLGIWARGKLQLTKQVLFRYNLSDQSTGSYLKVSGVCDFYTLLCLTTYFEISKLAFAGLTSLSPK